MKTIALPPIAPLKGDRRHQKFGCESSTNESMNLPMAHPSIRIDKLEDGIAVMTFDHTNSPANVFDLSLLTELDQRLHDLEGDKSLRGLVLMSAKPTIFIAGADLRGMLPLVQAGTPEAKSQLSTLIDLGQTLFNRVANLPVPTVAAIHGACVAGGYELCLACDYRIASSDRVTQIGLPETQLGILPAWGGATRLPRRIGLARALSVILEGKSVSASRARRQGMVDRIAPRERLLDVSRKLIGESGGKQRRSRSRNCSWFKRNAVTAAMLRTMVARRLERKIGQNYPAIFKALDVVTQGVHLSVAGSLSLEKSAFLELSATPTCHNLIRLFLLQERAKKLRIEGSVSAHHEFPTTKLEAGTEEPLAHESKVRSSAIIGAGVMGAGIAQWLSSRGIQVLLNDVNQTQVASGLTRVSRQFEQGLKRRRFTALEVRKAMDRIRPASSEVSLGNVDLVIEAAVETMDLKTKIFRQLDLRSGPHTLLATNTSALPIGLIAQATRSPDRVVGIHFFNPVHRMQLVEVVAGDATSQQSVQRALAFVQQIGKLPVVVKDRPGFLVNRVLLPYLLEALQLFEGGTDIETIDRAMMDFGMPMGPLRLIDEVGLDVATHVAGTLAAHFKDRIRIPKLVEQMQTAGLMGRKSGRGFYDHSTKRPTANKDLSRMTPGETSRRLDAAGLQQRMVLLMVNEAARCLEEGVVATPEDVDLGMVMGTGFAPFRGGPMRYADALGAGGIVNRLKREVAAGHQHYAPCDLLQEQAAKKNSFYIEKGINS